MKQDISGKNDGIHYSVKGEGKPLVFLHCGMMDSRIWEPQIEHFSRHFQVICVDARGYGKSARPRKAYSHHEDLAGLLNHLSIKKAHLCGCSLGGMTAIDFCLVYPDKVDKLVLAGPGVSGYPDKPEMLENFFRIITAGRDESAHAAAKLWLTDPYMIPAMEHKELRPILRRIALTNAHVWKNNPFMQRGLDPPAWDRLEQIKAPTLLIMGERDVEEIHETIAKLNEKIIGNRVVRYPGVGHIANMECPERFNKDVLQFLMTG
jgi:3-oxoadipate enol-lactonase